MVFYFTSTVVSTPYSIYMGIDKFENEDLIAFGFPEDIWFHVDKLSSAHVYLRLPPNHTIDAIPAAVLEDCAQLVKANSIQGNKVANINVVYTPWANLKKTGDMDVGQIGFYKGKEVKSFKVDKRKNDIINRLNKTKEERHPDLRAEREQRDRDERELNKRKVKEQKEIEKGEVKKRKEDADLRNYTSLMTTDKMTSNQDVDSDASDDFM